MALTLSPADGPRDGPRDRRWCPLVRERNELLFDFCPSVCDSPRNTTYTSVLEAAVTGLDLGARLGTSSRFPSRVSPVKRVPSGPHEALSTAPAPECPVPSARRALPAARPAPTSTC